jgi:two-component system sensor histidine kinase KdpD
MCSTRMNPNTPGSQRSHIVPRVAGALLLILAVTFLFSDIAPVNAQTVAFAYLLSILLLAAYLGLTEALVASLAATTCLNYFFLPPVGTFTIADTQNWIALFAFLMTSLVASQLSDRAKQRAIEAMNRQAEVERLYALSRAAMLTDASQPIGKQIAGEIARIYEFRSVAIYDRVRDEIHYAGPEDIPGIDKLLRDAALSRSLTRRDEQDLLVTDVSLGGQSIGSLAIQGLPMSDAALHALMNLVAISLEHSNNREVATRAEAARQSEEFKSTLLDGVAHEFKTPLTSIKAATSGLLASTVTDPSQQRELLTVIDEEADRLTHLVTEALHLARIEAGKIHLNRQPHQVRALIGASIQQVEPMWEDRNIDIEIQDNLQDVLVDGELMQLAIRQLLDNAVKYSPRQSSIHIRARSSNGSVAIAIHNSGDALSDSERDRIFEKFYRGISVRERVAGTGMGLAIAREILRAHGGDILVESSASQGTEFTAIIPAEKKGAP